MEAVEFLFGLLQVLGDLFEFLLSGLVLFFRLVVGLVELGELLFQPFDLLADLVGGRLGVGDPGGEGEEVAAMTPAAVRRRRQKPR